MVIKSLSLDLLYVELICFSFEQFIEFLVLKIPSYDNVEWISNSVDLGIRKKNDPNEQIIIFHYAQEILVRHKISLFFFVY